MTCLVDCVLFPAIHAFVSDPDPTKAIRDQCANLWDFHEQLLLRNIVVLEAFRKVTVIVSGEYLTLHKAIPCYHMLEKVLVSKDDDPGLEKMKILMRKSDGA